MSIQKTGDTEKNVVQSENDGRFELPSILLSKNLYDRLVYYDKDVDGRVVRECVRVVSLRFKDVSICREILVYRALRYDVDMNLVVSRRTNHEEEINEDCVFLYRSDLAIYDTTQHLADVRWNERMFIEVELMVCPEIVDLDKVRVVLFEYDHHDIHSQRELLTEKDRMNFFRQDSLVGQGMMGKIEKFGNSYEWILRLTSPFLFGRITMRTTIEFVVRPSERQFTKIEVPLLDDQVSELVSSHRLSCNVTPFRAPFSPIYLQENSKEHRVEMDLMSAMIIVPSIARALNLASGDLVNIQMEGNKSHKNDTESHSARLPYVCPAYVWSCAGIGKHLENKNIGACVSPWLWHLMGLSDIDVTRMSLRKHMDTTKVSRYQAEECYLELIHGKLNVVTQQKLERYFEVPRLVCEGSVFGVVSRDANSVVYFRVHSVRGASPTSESLLPLPTSPSYYVNRQVTKVILLGGHKEDRLPRYFQTFLVPDPRLYSNWSFPYSFLDVSSVAPASSIEWNPLVELGFGPFLNGLDGGPERRQITVLWYYIQCMFRNLPCLFLEDATQHIGVPIYSVSIDKDLS